MPSVVTFYSYKGGVGRTLALANVAWLLSSRGRRVVCVDLDLEAPSLHELFATDSPLVPGGFVELAATFAATGALTDVGRYLRRSPDAPGTGSIHILPSGIERADYGARLAALDWTRLEPLVDALKARLAEDLDPHYVLVDSRTGFSDLGGVATHRLADSVVLVFNLTRPCLDGTVRAYRSIWRGDRAPAGPVLVASPVPPRERGSLVDERLAKAAETMPLGVASGRDVIAIDYDAGMALSEELAVTDPERWPASARYVRLTDAVQRLNRNDSFAAEERADREREEGRPETGLAILQAFVDQTPGNPLAHEALGRYLLRTDRPHEAREALLRALALPGTTAEATVWLRSAIGSDVPQPETTWRWGAALLAQARGTGPAERRQALLSEAADLARTVAPESPRGAFVLSCALSLRGDQDAARAVLPRSGETVSEALATPDLKLLFDKYPELRQDLVRHLRIKYLEWIERDCGDLPLRGLDVEAADAESAPNQRSLADVYVALDTTTSVDHHETPEAAAPAERQGRPLSAAGALCAKRGIVLLGDPGSGKTTFIRHLAYCLAHHALDPAGKWRARLGPDWRDELMQLLPVPVVLRDLAIWIGQRGLTGGDAPMLADYLRHALDQVGLGAFHAELMGSLGNGQALLLLDGLDEVPPSGDAGRVIKQMLDDLPHAYPRSPRLVTCRVLSYQEARWKLSESDWPSFELAPFDEPRIDQFIDAWYQQLQASGRLRDATVRSDKLKRAVRRPDLRRLAHNPLLLTTMAIVHAHEGELPDARALLYEKAVDLLLYRWDTYREGGHAVGESPWRQLLRVAGLKEIDVKRALWELAFSSHAQVRGHDNPEATADILVDELASALSGLHPERSSEWALQMVDIINQRAGLLIETRPGVYRFPHRTFQEFLAACHLAKLRDFTERAVALAADGPFWWDVILLAVGREVDQAGDVDGPLALTAELCPRAVSDDATDVAWRKVWLAGRCVREIGTARAGRRDMGAELVERVRGRLVELVTTERLTPRERAEAGSVLAELGDPRDLGEMVPVPSGSFLMGEGKQAHEVEVAPFRIGKYPVTNAQYARFVDSASTTLEERERPRRWGGGEPPPEIANHPVTGVNWHDARAYCEWLAKERGEEVRLPTEAEWEKAARGTDGRRFPWGNTREPTRCNAAETGIGGTSPVGCFASGASPSGCLDMAGNVWEWCLSEWGIYPDADDGRNQVGRAGARVLRGGAFCFIQEDARCAFRNGYDPDFRDDGVGFRVLSPGL